MPKEESFRWENQVFDVSAMLEDIKSGRLSAVEREWPAVVVKRYFDLFLNRDTDFDRPPLHVDLTYAASLTFERLHDPIVLVHVGGRGLVAFEEHDDLPHHVVADGNHRIAKAAAKGMKLKALFLSRLQSQQYESLLGDQ